MSDEEQESNTPLIQMLCLTSMIPTKTGN